MVLLFFIFPEQEFKQQRRRNTQKPHPPEKVGHKPKSSAGNHRQNDKNNPPHQADHCCQYSPKHRFHLFLIRYLPFLEYVERVVFFGYREHRSPFENI